MRRRFCRSKSAEANFYYSGDTATLRWTWKLISEKTKIKFAVSSCVGGTSLTMDADDAIHAAGLVQCKEVMGVHYDTFPPIKIDHMLLPKKGNSGRRD